MQITIIFFWIDVIKAFLKITPSQNIQTHSRPQQALVYITMYSIYWEVRFTFTVMAIVWFRNNWCIGYFIIFLSWKNKENNNMWRNYIYI